MHKTFSDSSNSSGTPRVPTLPWVCCGGKAEAILPSTAHNHTYLPALQPHCTHPNCDHVFCEDCLLRSREENLVDGAKVHPSSLESGKAPQLKVKPLLTVDDEEDELSLGSVSLGKRKKNDASTGRVRGVVDKMTEEAERGKKKVVKKGGEKNAKIKEETTIAKQRGKEGNRIGNGIRKIKKEVAKRVRRTKGER